MTDFANSTILNAPLPWPWAIGILLVLTLVAATLVLWLHFKPSNTLYDVREPIARLFILSALLLMVLNGFVGMLLSMVTA